jgi:O-antigen/teichoic acid export membrane protein
MFLAIAWMTTTWVLGVPLMIRFGLIGFGIAVIAVQVTNISLYWAVWHEVSLSVWPTLWPSWPIALAVGSLVFSFQRLIPIQRLTTLGGVASAGLVVYVVVLWLGFPERMRILRRLAGGTG